MAKKTNYWLWGILGVLAISFVVVFSTKNRLLTLSESIDASWVSVENQLQRRYDLIPNLVNTVKGYADHEKEAFETIAEARARLAVAPSVSEKIAAATQLESDLSRLFLVLEKYPKLKTDQQFMRLVDELSGSEDRLSMERLRYNENVKIYNKSISNLPGSLVVGFFDYVERPSFKIEEAAQPSPGVDVGK